MFVEPSNETPPIVLGVVSLAAEPDVFWLPVIFTPGKSMFVEPSNETPPIVLGVVSLAAEPDHAEDDNVPVEPVPTITR